MGFVAQIFGGGAARHAANVQNVRDQATAQQQLQAGQTAYNQIIRNGQNQYNNIVSAGQGAYNQLVGAIPGITAPFQPMIQAGQSAATAYQNDLPYLSTAYAPTQAQLAATPGYQFTLQQGLESTQNAAAARGLGVSGAALKAASAYSTGLAQNTYAQDAGIYQANQQIIGNNLLNGMNAGTTAANYAGGLSSGLQTTASNDLLTAHTNAADLMQNAQQNAATANLGQVNQGSATQLAGYASAANGQLAYNNALANGLNVVANGISQGVSLYAGGATGGGSKSPVTSPQTFSSYQAPTTSFANQLIAAPPTAYGNGGTFYGRPTSYAAAP